MPRAASYLLFKLMKILTPVFKNIDIKNGSIENINLGDLNLEAIADSLFSLPENRV